METSFRLALVQSVWLDFEIVPLHKDQIPLNLPSLMCGTLDLTTVFIYSIFFSSKLHVFFRPLKLHLPISSLPKIASLARHSAKFLKLATLLPRLSANTCSIGLNFGGVVNGGG